MRRSHSLVTLQRIASFRQSPLLCSKGCSLRWLTTPRDPSLPTNKHPSHSSGGDRRHGWDPASTQQMDPGRTVQNRPNNVNQNDRYHRDHVNQNQRSRRRGKGSQQARPSFLNPAPPDAAKPNTKLEEVQASSGPTAPDISRLVETFTRLRVERDALDSLEAAPLVEVYSQLQPNPPPLSQSPEYLQRCRTLFQETVSWIDQVQQLGHTPGHAPSSELATLLGQSVSIFNKIPPAAATNGKTIRSQCRRVLGLLRKYNLSLRAFHYDCSIRVAIRENDWQYASKLYWEQIDPDAGNPPVSIALEDPVGLYAIARHTQLRGGAVADEVMDAVNQMSMISPMNQDKYVIAAGTALGYANAWESALNFLRTSLHSNQLGEPLVSATMHACIISNQHEQALKAFNERFGVSASITALAEWQVGGGAFRLSPLCRDLAMRASLDTQDAAACARALRYFQETQKENVSVSLEALLAVSRACETTGNWEDSVGVFFTVLDRSLEPGWIVSGHELSIGPIRPKVETNDETNLSWWIPGIVPVLASTVRSCNAAGHFATALLCTRLYELAFLSHLPITETGDGLSTGVDHQEELDLTMFRVVAEMQHDDELLAAMMTSICGLGAYNRAAGLFTRSRQARGLDASSVNAVRFSRKHDPRSAECFLYATSKSAVGAVESSSLDHVWGRIHRFAAAVRALELAGGILPPNHELTVANELADLMRSCTSAGYADVSICVARRTERLKLSGQTRSALAGMMMSFLGVADGSFSDFLLSHDATLAQYIRSYNLNGWHDAAITLFKSKVNVEKDTLSAWTSSCNAAIEALNVMNRSQDAIGIFRRLGAAANAETFNILGTALAKNEQWEQVNDLYAYVGQNGLFSAELAFLTMQAIVKTSDQPMEELRRIVSEAAKYEAMPDIQWLQANYWKLTSRLGVETSRGLIGWDGSDNHHVNELVLALDALDDRSLFAGNENDILWAVVLNTKTLLNQTGAAKETQDMGRLPRDGQEWLDLMLRVASAAKDTGILSDGLFLTEVICVLRALGGSSEIEELVNYWFSRGWKLDRKTLIEVREASKELGQSSQLVSDLEFLSLSAAQ